jgi:hypothetical protein
MTLDASSPVRKCFAARCAIISAVDTGERSDNGWSGERDNWWYRQLG